MTIDLLLLKSVENGIARLTMNRPQARNSLSLEMIRALQVELSTLANDASVRVLVIEGVGPAFCSGHDLKEIRASGYGQEYLHELFDSCSELMQAIVNFPCPVIAEVHGIATAAGCQLVASCDLAIAADDARFATPGVNIGLFCSTPMVALSRNVSRKHAMEMLLTGDLFSAQDAERFGLINRSVPSPDLRSTVDSLALKIASKSTHTIKIGKETFYQQAEYSLSEAYGFTCKVMLENMKAADAQEGIGAFLEKRSPVWCDR